MDQTELHSTIHMDVHMGICICQWIYIPMNMSTCVIMFMCILWIYTHWTLLNTPPVNTNTLFVLFLFHCVIFVTPIHIVFHCFFSLFCFMLCVHMIVLFIWIKGNKDRSIKITGPLMFPFCWLKPAVEQTVRSPVLRDSTSPLCHCNEWIEYIPCLVDVLWSYLHGKYHWPSISLL